MKNKITLPLLSLLISSLLYANEECRLGLEPKMDDNLPIINVDSINITVQGTDAIVKWTGVTEKNIAGYYVYRKNLSKPDDKFRLVGTIRNRYVQNFVDKNLLKNNKYAYSITIKAMKDKDCYESNPSDARAIVIGTEIDASNIQEISTRQKNYSYDKFYASTDENNNLISIHTEKLSEKEDIEILNNSISYINKEMTNRLKNGVAYQVICNPSDYCFNKYAKCSKGLLANKPEWECASKYYSVNSALVLPIRNDDGTIHKTGTIAATVFFAPIGALLGTAAVEKSFNDVYNNTIDKYSLEVNKNTIFEQLDSSTPKYNACDVSKYGDKDLTIFKNKECKYDENSGLFVFNGFEGNWLSEGNARFITLLSADELKFPIFATQKITQKLVDEYMDLDKIVPEVALPDILPEVALEKSDFEKQADFEKRKSQAIEKRENEQKLINEKYIKDVKERNEKYFDEATKRRATLDEKMDEFRKQAFLSISKTPLFEYESYDAETEKMYGFLINGEENRKVVLQMNGNEAKKITENLKNIIPSIEYELKKENELSSFEIKKLTLALDGNTYTMGYTDVNYKPTYMAVTIPSYDMSLYDTSIKDALRDSGTLSQNELKALQNVEQWRQKSMTGISDTTIIHTNAKAPNWYEKIECGDTVCGVGRATTQQEALKIAMNQVGCSVKASVSSKLNVQKTNNNGYLSKVATYDLKQTCDNQFNNGEITVTNSAEMDGWYYVRTVLNKK